jgi:hypothetical protein
MELARRWMYACSRVLENLSAPVQCYCKVTSLRPPRSRSPVSQSHTYRNRTNERMRDTYGSTRPRVITTHTHTHTHTHATVVNKSCIPFNQSESVRQPFKFHQHSSIINGVRKNATTTSTNTSGTSTNANTIRTNTNINTRV